MTHNEIIMHLRAAHQNDESVQALLSDMEAKYSKLVILKKQLTDDAYECYKLTDNPLFRELEKAYAAG